MLIVLDSNIFISALIKEGITRKIIMSSKNKFLLPEYSFVEIKRHKEEILSKSELSKNEFFVLMKKLLKYVKIVKKENILKHQERAKTIIGKIDKDDILFIATAIAFKCPIWSDDLHFKIQKEIKVYNTKEFMDIILNKS